MAHNGGGTVPSSHNCILKAAKKQLRRGLSSPQKASARITESLNNIGTTECHAIRSATLSEVLFWDNFDSISYVMPTSRPVPSATRTRIRAVQYCTVGRAIMSSRRRPPTHRAPPYLRQVRLGEIPDTVDSALGSAFAVSRSFITSVVMRRLWPKCFHQNCIPVVCITVCSSVFCCLCRAEHNAK